MNGNDKKKKKLPLMGRKMFMHSPELSFVCSKEDLICIQMNRNLQTASDLAKI